MKLLRELRQLYPKIERCQELVDTAILDGVINIREAQMLLQLPHVWYDYSTDGLDI